MTLAKANQGSILQIREEKVGPTEIDRPRNHGPGPVLHPKMIIAIKEEIGFEASALVDHHPQTVDLDDATIVKKKNSATTH
jgi:hypothetical protein